MNIKIEQMQNGKWKAAATSLNKSNEGKRVRLNAIGHTREEVTEKIEDAINDVNQK